jgi:copper transport protein
VALLLAGSFLLATVLRHLSDLWNTDYGRLVSGKIVVVAVLLAAAAVNKLRFTPRLQAEDAAAAIGLLRSIRAEVLLGGFILVITAALTSLVGPPGLE